jgi:hypothetical protein
MGILFSVQNSPYYIQVVVARAMCILSRAPSYGLLASKGGISATKNAWPRVIESTISALVPSWKAPSVIPTIKPR